MPAPRGAAGSAACPLEGRCHARLLNSRGVPGGERQLGQRRLCRCSVRLSAACDKASPRATRLWPRAGGVVAPRWPQDGTRASRQSTHVLSRAQHASHATCGGTGTPAALKPQPRAAGRRAGVLTPPRHQGSHEAAAPPSRKPGCCRAGPGEQQTALRQRCGTSRQPGCPSRAVGAPPAAWSPPQVGGRG